LKVQAASGANRVLTITALVDFGSKGVNHRTAFAALRTAQSLLGMLGGVTTIDITVQDIYAAEAIAQRIEAANAVEADSWIKTNAQFFTAVQAQETSNTLIRLFVALSVAFGIAAVLIVSVIQRSKDIGILRAMGTPRGQILRVFLLQGGLLGFVGSLFGAAMGAGALIYRHSVARQLDGSELFPLILERRLFVVTALLATLTGLLAAMAPAVRAAKLDPVVAIRGRGNSALGESLQSLQCWAYERDEVLHDIDLRLERGEFLALMGPSGSLLNIVGLLDRPTSGRLFIKGRDIGALGDADITLRGRTIGFVFQYHFLLSAFTAKENVMMPMLADRGFPDAQIGRRAAKMLAQVGLKKFADNLATNMSGGQQQRVAVARARDESRSGVGG
jgi:ABC-type multidrug transport system fused ATPase/permease subunit